MKSIVFEKNPNDYTISHGREILEVILEVSINGDLKKQKQTNKKTSNEVFCFTGNFKEYCGFPGGLDGKDSACNTGNLGSIPGLGRWPGEGNGNPFQCSCLENSMPEKPGP